MKILNLVAVALLGIAAASAFAASALVEQGDAIVTLCYRNRTIQVPFYLVSRYLSAGATAGPCVAAAAVATDSPLTADDSTHPPKSTTDQTLTRCCGNL